MIGERGFAILLIQLQQEGDSHWDDNIIMKYN